MIAAHAGEAALVPPKTTQRPAVYPSQLIALAGDMYASTPPSDAALKETSGVALPPLFTV
jgi:hypothetical protein